MYPRGQLKLSIDQRVGGAEGRLDQAPARSAARTRRREAGRSPGLDLIKAGFDSRWPPVVFGPSCICWLGTIDLAGGAFIGRRRVGSSDGSRVVGASAVDLGADDHQCFEAAGLTRASIDVLRSRITVASKAVEVRGHVTLSNEPKTSRSKRTVPVARSVIRRLEEHLANFVGPQSDPLVFTAPRGGPLARGLFSRRVWQPAVIRAGIPSITFHGLRHSFCGNPGGRWLQRPGGLGMGRPQQRRVHPDPIRRPL